MVLTLLYTGRRARACGASRARACGARTTRLRRDKLAPTLLKSPKIPYFSDHPSVLALSNYPVMVSAHFLLTHVLYESGLVSKLEPFFVFLALLNTFYGINA